MQLNVRPNGEAQCLYDEKIELQTLGAIDIKRASHVEPDPQNNGFWYIDLSPVDGPIMTGFKNRADALSAEAEWLNEKMRREHSTAHG